MPNATVDDLLQFRQEHGQEVPISEHVRVCRDGAVTKFVFDGMQLYPPPDDEHECLTVRRRYWRARLDSVIEHFNSYKHAALHGGPVNWKTIMLGPAPEFRSVKDLLVHLKVLHDEALKMLAAIQGELDATPQEIAAREAAQRLAEQELAAKISLDRERAAIEAIELSPTPILLPTEGE